MPTNIVDIFCIAVLIISILYGMYRGFISGILSLAGLIASIAGAFMLSPNLVSVLNKNETIVRTLKYYTDSASRIGSIDLSMLSVSKVNTNTLSTILEKANLPIGFRELFLKDMQTAVSTASVSDVLSQSIVSASINILSFLICFLGCYIVALFFIHMISYVFEFPVLRHLDSLVGGLFGFVRGYITLVVLFVLIPIVLTFAPITQIQELVNASQLAPLFDTKLIFSILGLGG
ncbi:MAG: CvpA family protein [Clostridia bacterium]|nr:CvpA family protein [Clostridia bacterium]